MATNQRAGECSLNHTESMKEPFFGGEGGFKRQGGVESGEPGTPVDGLLVEAPEPSRGLLEGKKRSRIRWKNRVTTLSDSCVRPLFFIMFVRVE